MIARRKVVNDAEHACHYYDFRPFNKDLISASQLAKGSRQKLENEEELVYLSLLLRYVLSNEVLVNI